MKKTALYGVAACVLLISFFTRVSFTTKEISYADFDRLEGKSTHFWRKLSDQDKKDLKFYKELYLQNLSNKTVDLEHTRIPKTIHYIWLGPNPFPQRSVAYVQSWMERHPGWTVKFWTDRQERVAPCVGMEKHLISELELPHIGSYLEKTDNWGEKSDLLRYEILLREGGVYVDHDIECYHDFTPLASSVDFFAGLEPPHKNQQIDSRVFCCNAIFGAKAAHPVLRASLKAVQNRWDEIEKAFPGNDALHCTLRVFLRTFYSFALAAKEAINQEGNKDIVLPASYFYPDRITTLKEFNDWKSKGLIWTSHKCAGEWRPIDTEASIKEKLELEKAEKRHLKKTMRQMRLSLYMSFALSGYCIFLSLRYKKKLRMTRARKSI